MAQPKEILLNKGACKMYEYTAPEAINTGVAVIVCPGGGYARLAHDHEGVQVAQWLNNNGINAFVLHYRHGPDHGHPLPLSDAQAALQYVHSSGAGLKIDTGKIGIMGFSAGGHLASTAGTHFQGIENARPNFMILIYPVITMTDTFTHAGSRTNLLGKVPGEEMIKKLSGEMNVTADTPPTFMVHTAEDTGVPMENSFNFYRALRAYKIPSELHIFEKGRHGLGLGTGERNPGGGYPAWPELCLKWMQNRKIIP